MTENLRKRELESLVEKGLNQRDTKRKIDRQARKEKKNLDSLNQAIESMVREGIELPKNSTYFANIENERRGTYTASWVLDDYVAAHPEAANEIGLLKNKYKNEEIERLSYGMKG